jgi:hypothetical protein
MLGERNHCMLVTKNAITYDEVYLNPFQLHRKNMFDV